jgi:hypothetical protein
MNMIDERSGQVIAAIAAMKLLLGHLYKTVYISAKLSPDDVRTIHEAMLKEFSDIPMGKSIDPAISDALSNEACHQIEKFLLGVERSYEAAWNALCPPASTQAPVPPRPRRASSFALHWRPWRPS